MAYCLSSSRIYFAYSTLFVGSTCGRRYISIAKSLKPTFQGNKWRLTSLQQLILFESVIQADRSFFRPFDAIKRQTCVIMSETRFITALPRGQLLVIRFFRRHVTFTKVITTCAILAFVCVNKFVSKWSISCHAVVKC